MNYVNFFATALQEKIDKKNLAKKPGHKEGSLKQVIIFFVFSLWILDLAINLDLHIALSPQSCSAN